MPEFIFIVIFMRSFRMFYVHIGRHDRAPDRAFAVRLNPDRDSGAQYNFWHGNPGNPCVRAENFEHGTTSRLSYSLRLRCPYTQSTLVRINTELGSPAWSIRTTFSQSLGTPNFAGAMNY